MDGGTGLLTPYESEHIVQSLSAVSLERIGDGDWFTHHRSLSRLNTQIHHSALTHHDEFTIEQLTLHDKASVLIGSLLVSEKWRESVLPIILHNDADMKLTQTTAMKTYFILYHELVLINIFECAAFHASFLAAAKDDIVELIDYCNRRINTATALSKQQTADDEETTDESAKTTSPAQTVRRHLRRITFDCSVSAVSIIRYITDNFSQLPLAAFARIVHTHDMMLVIAHVIAQPPWRRTRRNKNGDYEVEKFINHQWTKVKRDDDAMLTVLDGQSWLTLYNLTCTPLIQQSYQWNSHRQSIALTVRPALTPVLIDQLPPLVNLRRLLDELLVVAPPNPTATKMTIIEPVTPMQDVLNSIDCQQLAKQMTSATGVLSPEIKHDRDVLQCADVMTSMAPFFGISASSSQPPCHTCSAAATKRCSLCKSVWYCSRECQVADWKSHKSECTRTVAANKQYEEEQQHKNTQQQYSSESSSTMQERKEQQQSLPKHQQQYQSVPIRERAKIEIIED